MSAKQIERMLGVTYKTAWFMCHRFREAMCDPKAGPLGGEGKTVEADETFIGGKEKNRHKAKRAKKRLRRPVPPHRQGYASHGVVTHNADEYVRGDIHVNTAENYFSLLKRGITGVYHAVSEQLLQRYLFEFDFRYSRRDMTDAERADELLAGARGKRLYYQ